MSNSPSPRISSSLADALRSLPVPPLPADFDDCVLASLRVPRPWWKRLTWRGVWQPVQPLFVGASCSLGVSLLLLHLTLSGPPSVPTLSPVIVSNLAAAPSAPLPSVDALLNRPNLCAGSLAAAWNALPPAAPADASEPPPRKPEPRRRAAVYSCRPFLTA